MRIHISLAVSKPLLWGKMIKLPRFSDKLWVEFKYERLYDFCYHCGLLGYSFNHCIQFLVLEDTGIVHSLPYNLWMRGTSSRPAGLDRYKTDITRLARNTISPSLTYMPLATPFPILTFASEIEIGDAEHLLSERCHILADLFGSAITGRPTSTVTLVQNSSAQRNSGTITHDHQLQNSTALHVLNISLQVLSTMDPNTTLGPKKTTPVSFLDSTRKAKHRIADENIPP
ncbi:Zinc knuckle CX2CX4HX4C [Trema orientale]|uniref:Zinc knuckle CX2CX4HX4C n=1 Tax=Trema orientale TaxID=63057 RepID=A0A2P5FJ81_TREOI|nr:Zinc knuckle CX2CX4HX4C [Trema orientale]